MASEVARGYVYISTDKRLFGILDIEDFTVEIEGEVVPHRKIDSYGRVQIPRRLLRRLGAAGAVHMSLVSKKRLSIGIYGGGSRPQSGNGTVTI